jgi:pantoate--beta-alanine ligase
LKVFNIKADIEQYVLQLHNAGKTVGFVPTMGALHQGHLSLIKQARENNDVVVCSIFVNPTQFNDPADLEKYPRPIESDIAKLEQACCDILFNPAVNEIYAGNEQWHLNIGELEHLLEGEFRPGHYQGVTQVVYKLFAIIKPDTAYFGQKDFQQFLVIRKMTELMAIPVKLVMSPILREDGGLAMSSRNIHLTADDRQHALILSRTLAWVRDNFHISNNDKLKKEAERLIADEPGVTPEYFEIADGDTLHPANQNSKKIVALVAVRVGNTRLIDNVMLKTAHP